MFFVPKQEGDDLNICLSLQKVLFDEVLSEWKRNVAPPVWSSKRNKFIPNYRNPEWKPLCTYVRKYVHGRLRSNYDLHYVNPLLSSGSTADVSFYVLKYMMKPSDRQIRLQRALHLNLDEDEYNSIWSIVKCRHFESEGLGLGTSDYVKVDGRKRYSIPDKVYKYLRSGIELSKKVQDEPYACFYSPIDGKSVPLADYYKSIGTLFTMNDFLDFFYASKQPADNIIVEDDINVSQVDKGISDFDEKISNVVFRQSSDELDDLFDSNIDFQFLDF